MVQYAFDATKHDPSTGGMDVFETGEYLFHIVGSAPKKTSKGDGTMLILTAECLDPENAKKRIDIRLNVQNPSSQAMEIAYRDLSAICYSVGVLQFQDTEALHGKPFKIRLEKTTYTDKNGNEKPTNDIKGYLDANGNPPGQGGGQAGAAGAPPAPPSAPPTPPAGNAPAAPAAPPASAPAAAPPTAPAAGAEMPAQGGTPPWGASQEPQAAPPWGGNGATQAPPAGGSAPPWG